MRTLIYARSWLLAAAAALGTLWAGSAAPAPLPPALAGQVLKIVVGYAPGGAADMVARLYAEQLKGAGFASVVVENKPGASARLAWNQVRQARPDGLTLFLV